MTSSSAVRRLDVRAHFVPDTYPRAAQAADIVALDGMPAWPVWSEADALTTMDRMGITMAILSISSPGIRFGDDAAARQLARTVNEAGAVLVQRHPRRFGLFASLPLPDLAGALAELRNALDDLQADGVVLETNYHGVYPGDARLEPLMAALDQPRALVFVHSAAPPEPGRQQVSLG